MRRGAYGWPMISVRASLLVAVLILIAGRASPVLAEYAVPEIEQVPVDRLIANIEQRLAALDPAAEPAESLRLKSQLARVHALAYAQDARKLATARASGELYEHSWESSAVPLPPEGATQQRGDQTYLARALEIYEEVLGARPDDPYLQIGYAWCLEENGDRARAVGLYRAAGAAAWAEDQRISSLEFGALTLTQEAALRLIGLLDREDDAAEIAELERRMSHLDQIGRWITPIVIPLDDGLAPADLFDLAAAVPFDLDGSGVARAWRWITPQAAWLVWDPTGAGEITSGLDLFGSVTFWLFWENGYEALAALDDDGNGRLAGSEMLGLALWRDGNGDGLSQPGEVRPLAAWGIAALSVAHEPHPAGFPYSPRGLLLENGGSRPSYDWILQTAATPQLSSLAGGSERGMAVAD